jgi:hypothetical protein
MEQLEQLEQVEVKLLKYTFRFKRMRWQEESKIEFSPKKSPQRIVLAHALLEVAGIKPKTLEEANRVMESIPSAIVERVFKIWKGSFPPARKFTTSKLYCAPEPTQYVRQIEADEREEDDAHDKLVHSMESKFSPQEVAETRELEKQILSAARRKDGGYRGAVKPTEANHGRD